MKDRSKIIREIADCHAITLCKEVVCCKCQNVIKCKKLRTVKTFCNESFLDKCPFVMDVDNITLAIYLAGIK